MRNTVRFVIAGLLFGFVANAQTAFQKELTIGGSFGTNFSTVSFAPKIKTKQLMGFSGGISARWIAENHIGLQAEINYSQNGWDEDFEGQPYTYTRNLNYIEFPFLTHIFFGGKNARFFINLGPKIGYLISESETSNFSTPPEDRSVTAEYGKEVENKFAWGLCGGPGFEIRTKAGIFSLEGRYYYALGDIFKSRKDDPFPKSSNQVFSLKLAYYIPIL